MSIQHRDLSISSSSGGAADQTHTGHLQESAYEAVERALISRWIAIDWETHSLLLRLKGCLRMSIDQCIDILTRLREEVDRCAHNHCQPHVPQVQVASGPSGTRWGRGNLSPRHLYAEIELRRMEEAAYEAVERALRFQQGVRKQDVKQLQVLAQLRDLLGIDEYHYKHVLARLERCVKIRKSVPNPAQASLDPVQEGGDSPYDEPPFGLPGRVPKYRSLIELSYGSYEEWERRKLELQHSIASRGNHDAEDKDGLSATDDEETSLDKSDEEWKPSLD